MCEIGCAACGLCQRRAAVGHKAQRLDESSWSRDQQTPYYRWKILSERAAWRHSTFDKRAQLI